MPQVNTCINLFDNIILLFIEKETEKPETERATSPEIISREGAEGREVEDKGREEMREGSGRVSKVRELLQSNTKTQRTLLKIGARQWWHTL